MIYGTPTIVTNGLVLNLDAASPKAAPTRNLFTYTTDLTNVAWTKTRCSVTASATIAPDGTNTAFAFNMSTGSTDLKRLTSPNIASSVSGGLHTFSLFVKQNNFSGSGNASAGIQLGNYNSNQTAGVEPAFNVLSNYQSTGSFSIFPASSGSTVDRGAIDVGNGWYRIYATCNWASSVSSFSTFIDLDNGILTGSQYEGTGVYIWGPQFETGYLSPYQPVIGTTKPWPSIGSTITSSMVNNPTWISSNGGSIVFDGTNDYATVDNAISNNSDFSINFWMNYLGGNTQTGILSTWDTSWNGFGLATSIVNSAEWTLRSWTNNGASGGMNWGVLNNLKNTWSNIVLTYNFAAKRQSGYINGIFLNSEVFGSALTHSTLQIARGGQTASSQLSGYPYSNIRISDLTIYNKVLSQQEITQNYNALKSRFGLS